MVRTLAAHKCGLGLIPARCHIWIEFGVGSRLAPRVFLRVFRRVLWVSVVPPQKPISPKFQFDQDRGLA